MSYEYTLFLSEILPVKDVFLNKIRTSSVFIGECNGVFALADPQLDRSWNYDARIIEEDGNKFIIEVSATSSILYWTLKRSLEGMEYKLMDVDCEEAVSLESVFRI